jgi:ParB-like chromosome segregation protein Spo0J
MNEKQTMFMYGEFKIDNEIDDLFSNLPDWEYNELKKDIQHNGIRNPLVVTKNKTVICGHQRIRIAKELQLSIEKIPFLTKDFKNQKQLIEFAVNDNLLRRQLNKFQKGVIALKLLPYYEEAAKKRKISGTSVKNLTKGGRALEKIAEKVGISHVTLHKIRYIVNQANETQVKEVSNGDISISQCYELLKNSDSEFNSSDLLEGRHLEIVNYGDLEFNKYNPNVMNDETMGYLKASIENLGFTKPILTTKRNGKYFVIDGEKRAIAMKELGNTQIPTLVMENCSYLKAYLGSIALNNPAHRLSYKEIKESPRFKELKETYDKETLRKYVPFIDKIY